MCVWSLKMVSIASPSCHMEDVQCPRFSMSAIKRGVEVIKRCLLCCTLCLIWRKKHTHMLRSMFKKKTEFGFIFQSLNVHFLLFFFFTCVWWNLTAFYCLQLVYWQLVCQICRELMAKTATPGVFTSNPLRTDVAALLLGNFSTVRLIV